ncbi:hypothetical protein [Helicobacter felis]|uniref:hypothetical protein n=1 Tax=Helicobacter felis TaxID=214 RepID=UPI000CF16564|nr:hypothetical protein [Helicobacter felis]
MLILLDGPDRVGKDTLSRGLLAHFSTEVFLLLHTIHIDTYTQAHYLHWYAYIFDLALKKESSIILNRTHLSEAVFGAMYRHYDSACVFELEQKILDMEEVFLILLVDRLDRLMEREDGQSIHKDPQQKQEEIDRFHAAFDRSQIPHKIKIDIQHLNEKQVLAKTLQFIKAQISS